jgi:hypothetical protein
LVLVGLPGLARAQPVTPYTPRIAGVPMSCMSSQGVPVAFVPNTSLADVGLWFPSWPDVPAHVEYNPVLLDQLPPEVQLFWFWHTCAHGVHGNVSSEESADCEAIQYLRRQGLVSREEVLELQSWFVNAPVRIPWGHRPGRSRAQLLPGCYDRASGAMVFDSNGQPMFPGQTVLPAPAREEYPGVKRWRFCSHIPGVSVPTSSGHVTQGSCDKARARLQREDANYVVTECVLTSVDRCTARER